MGIETIVKIDTPILITHAVITQFQIVLHSLSNSGYRTINNPSDTPRTSENILRKKVKRHTTK